MKRVITVMFGLLIAFCAVAAVPKDFVKEKKETKTEQVVSVSVSNLENVVLNDVDISPGNYNCDVEVSVTLEVTKPIEVKDTSFIRKIRQGKTDVLHKKTHEPPAER